MLLSLSLLGTLGLSSIAGAKTINVAVGQDGFVFSPNSITANVGDLIAFDIHPPHSVVEGDGFNNPCAFKPGGFFSGFSSTEQTFTIKVTDTNPIWLYCSVPTHCQGGMVAVINAPAGKSISDYAAAAAKTSKSTDPGAKSGGESLSSSSAVSASTTPSSSVASSASKSTTETTTAVSTATTSTIATTATTATIASNATTATTATTIATTQTGNASVTSSAISPPIQTSSASSTVMTSVFIGLIAIVAGWATLL